MKKILLIVLVIVLGAAVYGGYEFLKTVGDCISNCDNGSIVGNGGVAVRGSGKITTETRVLGPFTSIHLTGIGKAMVDRTGTISLSVSGDDNLLPVIVSEVKDGALYLSIKQGTSISAAHVQYYVTVVDLHQVDVSGSATLQAVDLDGGTLAVKVSDAGRVSLSGRVDDLTAAVGGAGALDAAALNVRRATVAASGSGTIVVNARDTLDATASGAASIKYAGTPKLATHTSGAGSVGQLQQ